MLNIASCDPKPVRSGSTTEGPFSSHHIISSVLPVANEVTLTRPSDTDSAPYFVAAPRETEVLKLIAAGLTAKAAAKQLDLSLSSIETYKTRAAEKLGLKTRAEIVRYASSQGWLASA